MRLFHYYEASNGAFRNLSDLSIPEAQCILDEIKKKNEVFAAQRYDGYLQRRRELETLARDIFIQKGGRPVREVPHYMVIEKCVWLATWFKEPRFVSIPLSAFVADTLSFSYGDLFPTFSPRVTDGKEYRKQVYTYDEVLGLIEKYGLPQHWNADGRFGPERYIEVQVWDDAPIKEVLRLHAQ